MELDFFIIGAQKSASTFVHHCLLDHPEVCMPSDESPIFEDPEFLDGEVIDWSSFSSDTFRGKYGIKRPCSLQLENVPGRVSRKHPDLKFLVILREPISRTRSAYFHYMANGFAPVLGFNKGMENLLDEVTQVKWKRAHEILQFSQYSEGIRRYFDFFSRDQFLFLLHDDLKNDRDAALKSVYDFVGVNTAHRSVALETRPQAVSYSLFGAKVTSMRKRVVLRYNRDRTRMYRKERKGLLDGIRLKGIDWYEKSSRRSECSTDLELSSHTTARLGEIFGPDLVETENLTGLDLSEWRSHLVV